MWHLPAKEHLFLKLAIKYAEDEREPSEFLQDIGYDNWRAGGNIINGYLSYFRDTDTKVREMIKDSELEREKALRKRLIIESLDSGDFNEVMKNTLILGIIKENKNGLKFNLRNHALEESAIEDMIDIAKSIAHDYEHGFERTKDEKACGECGYRLYCRE